MVRRLYLFWSEQPDVWVDVSATLDRKLAALAEHRSQIREPERLEERIRAWAAEEGEPIGATAAESLRLIVIDEDEDESGELVASADAGTDRDAAIESAAGSTST